MMSTAPDYTSTLDLRDVVETIREHADQREHLDDDERDELREALRFVRAFRSDLGIAAGLDAFEDYAENEPTAIPEGEFQDYAAELAADIGSFHIPADPCSYGSKARDLSAEWPFRHIDWKAAADELRQDFSSFDFDGRTYYVRSY